MTSGPPVAVKRLVFLDALRGFALVMMVWNHSARWWQDRSMGWPWYYSVYVTMAVAAPTFLLLAGFSLSLSLVKTAYTRDIFGTLRKYLVRGVRVILAGLLLNVLVFPEDPFWSNGVLQTIGLGIIVAAPVGLLLRWPGGRYVVLSLSVLVYLSFVWFYGFISDWVAAHPASSRVLFFEFPPWPWIALVLLGLAAGALWVEASYEDAWDRYMRRMAVAGALCIAWLFAYDWWASTPNRFMFKRDFILNNHWTPRGATVAWVIGMTFCLMALFYYLAEILRVRLTWLATLGRTALILYFVHHLIVLTLVNQHWHWKFNNWWRFALAELALLAVLLAIARSWIEIKRLFGRRYPGAAAILLRA